MNKVLTANRLTDGIAVWLGANGQWLESIDNALIGRHQEAVDALEEAGKSAFNDNLVVDVDLIDVEEIDGDIFPIRLRERIRAAGPTIRTDLGKQSEFKPATAA
ncbi:DUF2849 domain-containing protein [Hoeflea poritis]|uniref:DUF2849 domain-containing protein n=1 Tax=Hoeflea poritis TaxID=2993659 RepID=A0ABT4VRB0_9HYPH|nr:DUF2849 domain-containing protein [Hoeflea poritis]MDA4847149.1 DUF2849 domain-containing protein [Hoeflea poritis]